MDLSTRVQILDKAVCISHSANTLGKGMHPATLPPAMGKYIYTLNIIISWFLSKNNEDLIYIREDN